jgi:molybdopterin adenylyltransferase
VVTVSDRSARGERADTSGPRLAGLVEGAGHRVAHVAVIPDEPDEIAALISDLCDGRVLDPAPDLVLTTGGTGLGPRDRTPEATRATIERQVPGIAEAIRAASLPRVPAAMLSRGEAGVRRRTLVVNLPGSTGGVADGWAVLAPVVEHACAQIGGADH